MQMCMIRFIEIPLKCGLYFIYGLFSVGRCCRYQLPTSRALASSPPSLPHASLLFFVVLCFWEDRRRKVGCAFRRPTCNAAGTMLGQPPQCYICCHHVVAYRKMIMLRCNIDLIFINPFSMLNAGSFYSITVIAATRK